MNNTEFHDAIIRAWMLFIMKLGIVHVLILPFLKVLNEDIHRYHFLGRIIIPLAIGRSKCVLPNRFTVVLGKGINITLKLASNLTHSIPAVPPSIGRQLYS